MTRRAAMLDTFAGPLYWAVLAASVVMLLRGHIEPGGGFVGALIAICATILWAVAHGSDAAARRLPLRSPLRLAACGALLSALSGLPAWWLGQAYLTHPWAVLPLGFTELPMSTVLLFDVGVYLCVWGALGGYVLALLGLDEAADEADGAAADATAADATAEANAATRGQR